MHFISLYAAFEVYPSRKGASTHMDHMTEVLARSAPPLLCCTLEGEEMSVFDRHISYRRYTSSEIHYLDRGRNFSSWLSAQLKNERPFEIAQFRDIWSGLPILESRSAWLTVYEANGFPSIELPYRFPDISATTLKKIRSLEMYCLSESDIIICPSQTIKNFILSLGLRESKIHVIPNGAVIPEASLKPQDLPENYILYFGAVQPWQGIDTLIRAFKNLQDMENLYLLICSAQREKYSRPYRKLGEQAGLAGKIRWFHLLDTGELNPIIEHSLFTVAPLKETARNTVQGCSPLKIFESMALGRTVLASDIPPVREIITDGYDGLLVRPDRPTELSRKIRMLVDFPRLAGQLGSQARQTIQKNFLWENSKTRLSQLFNTNRADAA